MRPDRSTSNSRSGTAASVAASSCCATRRVASAPLALGDVLHRALHRHDDATAIEHGFAQHAQVQPPARRAGGLDLVVEGFPAGQAAADAAAQRLRQRRRAAVQPHRLAGVGPEQFAEFGRQRQLSARGLATPAAQARQPARHAQPGLAAAQFLLGQLALGELGEGDHHLAQVARIAVQRKGTAQRPHRVRQVGPPCAHHQVAQGLAGAQHLVDRVALHRHRRAVFLDELPERVDGLAAAHLVQREAQDPTGRGIGVQHLGVGAVQHHARTQGLEQGPGLALAQAQRVLDTLAFADVGDHGIAALHLALPVAVGHQGQHHLADALPRGGGTVGADRIAGQGPIEQRRDPAATGRVAQHVASAAAQDVDGPHAKPAFVGGVDEKVAAVAVQPGHRPGQRIGHAGQLRFAVTQRLAGLHARADIHVRTHHAPRHAGRIAIDHACPIQDPHPMAVAMAQAVGGFERCTLALQMGLQGGQHGHLVLGVQPRLPGFVVRGHLAGPQSDHREPAFVDRHAPAGQFGVPQRQIGTAQRQGQLVGMCGLLGRALAGQCDHLVAPALQQPHGLPRSAQQSQEGHGGNGDLALPGFMNIIQCAADREHQPVHRRRGGPEVALGDQANPGLPRHLAKPHGLLQAAFAVLHERCIRLGPAADPGRRRAGDQHRATCMHDVGLHVVGIAHRIQHGAEETRVQPGHQGTPETLRSRRHDQGQVQHGPLRPFGLGP
jgi:hypothetical protein